MTIKLEWFKEVFQKKDVDNEGKKISEQYESVNNFDDEK